MMKVLLVRYHDKGNINTRLPESLNEIQGVYPPLGIAYIAANLEKHGFNVKILDAQALNILSTEARDFIMKEKPDVVGISAMTPNFEGVLEVAKFSKESGATVVLGGPQISTYPKESIDYDFVDYAIEGEAEEAFVELLKRIENKKSVVGVPGLVYKKGNKIHSSGPTIIMDLNSIPMPAWHLLPMDKYKCIITEKPFITMITSRGCPYQCGFCFKSATDKINRRHNPKSIVDEIEKCIEKYKIKEVMFYDDTLTLKRDHIEGICNEILKRGLKIKWEGPTRLNVVDKELLVLMKKAGCFRLRFGVESGDPRILKLMRKGITLDLARKVFRWTKQAGIQRFAYFMIGYYSEDAKTMRNTINFAKELDPEWIMFTAATPLPKTNLFDLCTKDGLTDENYWLDYMKGKNDGRMDYIVKDADKWAKKAYMEFYLRPSYIFKKIMTLKSPYDVMNNIKGAIAILRIR
ncbi:MAG: cobalamin-dependent protein [Candidatus Aenigmarchaeota archaeon]|nr:cobalamin-dependent protein [Candidatus Aenigmarchaeota archaeon]